jgi:hypothetical protein
MTTEALKGSTKTAATAKNSLLSSRRDKFFAACAGVAGLGLVLLLLNGLLKRRAARKNRVWH